MIGSGNKTIIGVVLDKSAKEAIQKHIMEYLDDESIEELWECTRYKAPFKEFYTDEEARNSHPRLYKFKAFSDDGLLGNTNVSARTRSSMSGLNFEFERSSSSDSSSSSSDSPTSKRAKRSSKKKARI